MKAHPIKLVVIFLYTLLSLPTEAVKFEHYSDSQGLKSNSVFTILQDREGFLWFGTRRGLARYDGYIFKNYTPHGDQTKINANRIVSLFEDSERNLWVGTQDGLHLFDRLTEQFRPIAIEVNGQKGEVLVRAIFEGRDGFIWIGTERGVFILEKGDGVARKYHCKENAEPSGLDERVLAIDADSRGDVWITTRKSLVCIKGGGASCSDYPFAETAGNETVYSIQSSCLTDRDEIWLGIRGLGLVRFDVASSRYVRFSGNHPDLKELSGNYIFQIQEDQAGALWLATINGLFRVSRDKDRVSLFRHNPGDAASLSQNDVRAVFSDRNSNIWIGTFGGGINKIGRYSLHFQHIREGRDPLETLSNKMVWSILQDSRGGILIGTDQGLNYWHPEKKRFFLYRKFSGEGNFPSNMITSLLEDDAGNIWVGTAGGGLKQFDLKNGDFLDYTRILGERENRVKGNYINTMIWDGNGRLLLGTDRGLAAFDVFRQEYLPAWENLNAAEISRLIVLSLASDTQKTLWAGTSEGLYFKNSGNGDRFLLFNKIPEKRTVNIVYPSAKGDLWVGTNSGLYCVTGAQSELFYWGRKQGLPDERIRSITEDHRGDLWLGTGQGLCRLIPSQGRLLSFSTNDGLPGSEFNSRASLMSDQGTIYLGGMDGVVFFTPSEIKSNDAMPQVVITEFSLSSRSADLEKRYALNQMANNGGELKLFRHENFFSFEFAALDFTNPVKNRYRYKLDGFEEEWNETDATRRFAQYTGVPPGRYTFLVLGSNNEDIWNPEGASIRIVILPPFWQKTWFRLLIFVVAGILLYALYRWRIKKVEQRLRKDNAVDQLCEKYKISSREREILSLVLEGKSNKEIEDLLFISYNTVKIM